MENSEEHLCRGDMARTCTGPDGPPVEHSLTCACKPTAGPPSLGKCVALVGDVVVWLHGTGLCERYEPFHR